MMKIIREKEREQNALQAMTKMISLGAERRTKTKIESGNYRLVMAAREMDVSPASRSHQQVGSHAGLPAGQDGVHRHGILDMFSVSLVEPPPPNWG